MSSVQLLQLIPMEGHTNGVFLSSNKVNLDELTCEDDGDDDSQEDGQ